MLKYLFRFFQDPYSAVSGRLWPLIRLIYRTQFLHFGHSTIISPTRLLGTRHIWIGDDTIIDHHCEIHAEPMDAMIGQPVIKIGNGCRINGFNRIGAVSSVEIQDYVLMASNIFISDSDHQYLDIDDPVVFQPWVCRGPVIIETGCWLGDGVKVVGGVRIGRNSVIGANAVVNCDIPAYSVAVGAPAHVVKRWEPTEQRWVKVK